MEWSELYKEDRRPTFEEIDAFIGSVLWPEMNAFLERSYNAAPQICYSGCSGQRGWNVKYQKSGKSLCTLYPMPGYFIALIVIGAKEEPEAGLLMPACGDYMRNLYGQAVFSAGGKWLMVHITDEQILRDAQALIKLRVKPKSQAASF